MDTRIKSIVETSTCGKHRATEGVSCWGIETSNGLVLSAVCNKRAKKAGFFGQITEKSLAKSFRSNSN